MNTAVVVDTNVAAVANGRHAKASPDCILTCIQALEAVCNGQLILLDDGMRILEEYRSHLSLAGQPGPGDRFMKWLWSNHTNPERCRLVPITPTSTDESDFEEFPRDPELSAFDRNDRKFAAVGLASGQKFIVQDASDSDWWHFREPLRKNGVTIEFLCPELMPPISRHESRSVSATKPPRSRARRGRVEPVPRDPRR